MYRRVLATGVTAAAIIGAGATAMAVTGSDTTNGSPSTASSSSTPATPKAGKHAGKHAGQHGLGKLGRVAHAQIVTKGKDGFVTHDLIRGTVSSVSTTSITVVAADKKSETFAVIKDTSVRERTMPAKDSTTGKKAKGAKGKGAESSISKIAKGDTVFVAGTGTTTYTAKHIIKIVTK